MDKLIEQFEHLKMTAASKDVNEDPSIKDLIETYSKAVLDCTFFHENYLTEHNFRLESTDEDIVTTLHLLDSIVALCASVDKSGHKLDEIQSLSQITSTPSTLFKTKTTSGDSYQSVVNVLGIDFGECILWRQGSLLYAFCSAKLSSDPCWVKNNQNRLLSRLRDGINYFHLMLSLRGDLISPLLREDHADNSTYSQQSDKSPPPSIHVDYPRAQQNIAFVSAKDFNLNNSANVLGKLLLQKQQIVGALGQELDELQKSLDEQQSFHQAIQEDIEKKLYRNPEMRSHFEPALAEITIKKEEVREQQEKNVEKKHQIEECLKQLQSQQDELAPAARAPTPNTDSQRFAGENAVNTLELIDMGIMSDSHMLAMMYCGDMSFWFCKYSQDWNSPNSSNRINFEEIKNIGISYLKIYIRAVERILRFNGWNCERAKDLLKYFSELK